MENNHTWLLIAGASQARIFSMYKAKFISDPNPRHLELIEQFSHDKSRLKNQDLMSDKMGEFGKGTFSEASSPKSLEAEYFAVELLKYLETKKQEKIYRDLIIVSPPAFIGLLHKHMPHEMKKMISQQIEKDYTKYQGMELVNNLMLHF